MIEPLEADQSANFPAPVGNADRVRVIACGAIAREVITVCKLNGLGHVDLVCLPAIWHVYPKKIAPAMREAIRQARSEGFERIFIGYAECGTQGELDRICAEEKVERIGGPHCYAFFSGTEAFVENAGNEFTVFYLTDLLARQFEAFVIKPMKFDRHPELKQMVFGNYTKIVYLAQTEDAELQRRAKWAADYLGLDYEYRFTGYGDLTASIVAAAKGLPQPELRIEGLVG